MNKFLFKTISTQELLKVLDKKETKILDLRQIDAYNGWKLNNEKRGGHIKNAKSLPFKWTKYMDWIEIVRSKNILPEDKIILYSYSDNETQKLAQLFHKWGYRNISIYYDFLKQWSKEDNFPMDKLARFDRLVPPQWLKKLIAGENPEEYDNDKFVIVHSHYRNILDYAQEHIPEAIQMDTNLLESPVTWNRRQPEELKVALESNGITADTTVILYGRFSAPDNNYPFPGSNAGHLGAIRQAAIMMYAGVKDVRVLNGGIHSWKEQDYETTKKYFYPRRVFDFGEKVPVNKKIFIDTPEAKEYIADKNKELVSIRSWEEYIGNVSGYNYIEQKGRIKGSVFGNCGTDAYHMENYRNLDHTTREYHEIAEMLEKAGLNPNKNIAFYCGTGWRGSEAWFNTFLMGWHKTAIYDGGWFEWSADPNNPTLTGEPIAQINSK